MNWKQVLTVIIFGLVFAISAGTSFDRHDRPFGVTMMCVSLLFGVLFYHLFGYKRCPKCGERIRREAQICRFCKFEIGKKTQKATVTPVVHSQQEIVSKEDQSKPVTSETTTEEATTENEMSVPRVRYQTEASSSKVDISKIPTHRSDWKIALGMLLFLFGCYRFGVSYRPTDERLATHVLYSLLGFALQDPLTFLISLSGLLLIFLELYERTQARNAKKSSKASSKGRR